ncbi:MAG: pantoate--beta-alanine ligase [Planctomycetota bacterium]|jgi:pantoate--beta-alanine ligase
MKVSETIEEIRHLVADEAKAGGRSIGLVPTMGGMHEGHLSLIEAAVSACDFVVVSIFVNPTQFAPGEDLASYPRTPEADLAACERLGVDAVFAPSVETMYGEGSLTKVAVAQLSGTLCGAQRRGHFVGVCTVVAKLFNIVHPDKAFFGAKDFQQAVIIRRMVRDLNFPVDIVICPTVREDDGLAMSTRNKYLTAPQRTEATALYGALQTGAKLIRDSHPPAGQIIVAMRDHLAANAPQGEIDYVQVVDPETLCDVEATDRPVLLALAVRIGDARLIDNTLVDDASNDP